MLYKGFGVSRSASPLEAETLEACNSAMKRILMQSEISSFINYITVEQGLAFNTQAAYRRDLEKFAKFLERRKSSTSFGQQGFGTDIPR